MDERTEVDVELPPGVVGGAGFEAFLRDGYDKLLGALYLSTGDVN